MKIKHMLILMSSSVGLGLIVSAIVYATSANYAQNIEAEWKDLQSIRTSLDLLLVELNKMDSEPLPSQKEKIKKATGDLEKDFLRIEGLHIIPSLSTDTKKAVDSIVALHPLINDDLEEVSRQFDQLILLAEKIFLATHDVTVYKFLTDDWAVRQESFHVAEQVIERIETLIASLNQTMSESSLIIATQFHMLDNEIESIKQRSSFVAILSGLTLIALTILATLLLSRFINGRIRKLGSLFKQVSAGDFQIEKFAQRSHDELSDLYNEIEKLSLGLKSKVSSIMEFIFTIGDSIDSKASNSELLDLIVNLTLNKTEADGVVILLMQGSKDILQVKSASGYTGELQKDTIIHLPKEPYSFALNDPTGLFLRDSHQIKEIVTDEFGGIPSSILLIPLKFSGKSSGLLVALTRSNSEALNDLDEINIQAFSAYASVTIDAKLKKDLSEEKRRLDEEVDLASQLQRNLLPKVLPRMKSLRMSAFSNPVRKVGGDYYDAVQVGAHRVVVIIADVAGKGIPASLVMTMICSVFHLKVSSTNDPAKILSWINRAVNHKVNVDRFATASLVIYDQTSSTVEYSNAAHGPLLHISNATGDAVLHDSGGLPLGIDQNGNYETKTISVSAGDVLVLETDGITEARSPNGEEFGLERLKQICLEQARNTPEEITDAVRKAVEQFRSSRPQHDDETLVILKFA